MFTTCHDILSDGLDLQQSEGQIRVETARTFGLA
jgi:hypothetical protein